jgi:hypothetical protein
MTNTAEAGGIAGERIGTVEILRVQPSSVVEVFD